MNPVVSGVLDAYREIYRPERECRCQTTQNNMPVVCPLHEWKRQVRNRQNQLVEAELSLPIPPTTKKHSQTDNCLSAARGTDDNPHNFLRRPLGGRRAINLKTGQPDVLSTNLAWELAQMGHIVVHAGRSFAITQTFRGNNGIRDAFTYAPFLVFCNTKDARNGHWIDTAIRARPRGLAFVISGR